MDYQVSNKAKIWTTLLMVVGIVFTAIGVVIASGHGHLQQQFMANLLSNSFFFFSIGISALFFLALNYATETGWFAYIKRVLESITSILPMAMIIFLITLVTISFLDGAHIYLWMDSEIMEKGGTHYDELAAHKGGYLNLTFFWIRTLLYFGFYYIMWKGFIKRSRLQDENPDNAVDLHFKNYRRGALFLIIFAFFSSTSSWDWIMSIDIHWYSTLFGWYVFAGGWTSAMVVLILLLIHLKKQGYLPQLNDSHIHDVGKWTFAISFLWSYLWFSQYMLYWYANIPEEAAYYVNRVENFKLLYFGMFFVNFAFPMLILMSRDAKRNTGILTFVGIIILIGHWLDVWIMIMGGSMGPTASMGLLEIGMVLAFIGLFWRVILVKLSKSPLVAKNHPFLDESIHHEI